MITEVIAITTAFSLVLIVYHHGLYPWLLTKLSKLQKVSTATPVKRGYASSPDDPHLPTIRIIVPAYNEQEFIADKIRNLATLDYPSHKLSVSIVCDGCTDDTAANARAACSEVTCSDLRLTVIEHRHNRGKVAALNEAIAASTDDLVALSDVSALISSDALLTAAAHFSDPRVGIVTGSYRFWRPGSAGETAYWRYQARIKAGESAMGSTIGAHGAFYVLRRAHFDPLPADTINDDFILPMNVVNKGFRAVYEPAIVALELESADPALDHARRIRIASGNVQQALRVVARLSFRQPGVMFNFVSGKLLRVFMPFVLIWALIGSAWMAFQGSIIFSIALAMQMFCYGIAALPILSRRTHWPRSVTAAHYFASGHIAGLRGTLAFAMGYQRGYWSRATVRDQSAAFAIHPFARFGKRAIDVIGAVLGLILSAPLFPIIALTIKLTSPGPVLFRQLRIGRAHPQAVELFTMLKFRTMHIDAEAKSGPQWASKNDPRITPTGRWLRKTRLDELPQLLNVLAGEMSLIGPRPERPGFYGKLEAEIPFYAERTYGVLPGITGLAQVNQGYDETIADVRRKVAFDHAYALALSRPMTWFQTDLQIAWKTLAVMMLGRGQ